MLRSSSFRQRVTRFPFCALQGIIGMRALSSLSTLRTNGYPLILISGER